MTNSPKAKSEAKSKAKTSRVTLHMPSIADVAAAIGTPVDAWPGKCDHIVHAVLDAGLFPGAKARYGQYAGLVDKKSDLAASPWQQHGWIELQDGTVIDPTRWVFEAADPYIATIPPGDRRQRQYDVGGARHEGRLRGPPPGPHEHSPNQKSVTPCPLDTTDPAALAFIRKNFTCEPAQLTIYQVNWLANTSRAELGKAMMPIYRAIEAAGQKGLVPGDLWSAAME